jgi:hypothetical protein
MFGYVGKTNDKILVGIRPGNQKLEKREDDGRITLR